jgi:hypothetical protein
MKVSASLNSDSKALPSMASSLVCRVVEQGFAEDGVAAVSVFIPLPRIGRGQEGEGGGHSAGMLLDLFTFAYKLFRNLQYRSQGGRPTSFFQSTRPVSSPKAIVDTAVSDLAVAVVASPEDLSYLYNFPPFAALLAESAGFGFLTWSELGTRATCEKSALLAIAAHNDQFIGCDESVMNAAYVISFDNQSDGVLVAPTGWEPAPSSAIAREQFVWLASPSTGIIGDASRVAFHEAAATFGPTRCNPFALLTPRARRSFQNKPIFTGGDGTAPNKLKIADIDGVDNDDDDTCSGSGGSTVELITSPILGSFNIKIWTSPMEVGAVQYAISLLRLSGMSPTLLEKQMPLLFEKVVYLINTQAELLLEVVEAVEAAVLLFVPPFTATISGGKLQCRAPTKADLCILFDSVRLCFRLSANDAAVRIGTLALRLCGNECVAAQILCGRCLEAADDVSGARACFEAARALQGDHVEAAQALRRLDMVPDASGDNWRPAGDVSVLRGSENDGVRSEDPTATKRHILWERLASRARQRSHERMGFRCLETASRLSTSKMYMLMRKFYESKGMEAWSGGNEHSSDTVPFYITSNPYIVSAYVRTTLSLVLDYNAQGMLDRSAPLYILELGAGPGKFSAIFLAHLERALAARRQSALNELTIVYVMTDFTTSNVDAWRTEPALQPHITSGLLDFAVVDVDKPSVEINLIRSGVRLSSRVPTVNPVLAFANYVLDSLGMDAFRKHSGLLQEALVSTYVRSSDDAGAAAGGGITFADPSIPGNIKQEWSYKALPGLKQYYTAIHDGDEIDLKVKGGNDKGKARASNVAKALDEVLEDYLGCLEEDSTFTLPVSGMRIVPFLQSLTRSGCVSMLISDKGMNRGKMISRKGDPVINLHGSLSMMVNLEALERFTLHLAELEGVGSTILHTPQQSSSLDVCFLNIGLEEPKRASLAFINSLCLFGIDDLFIVRDYAEAIRRANMHAMDERRLKTPGTNDRVQAYNEVPMMLVMAMLQLSGWDPDLLWQVGERLVECVKQGKEAERGFLLELASNFHRIQDSYTARFDVDGSQLSACKNLRLLLKGSVAAGHLKPLC